VIGARLTAAALALSVAAIVLFTGTNDAGHSRANQISLELLLNETARIDTLGTEITETAARINEGGNQVELLALNFNLKQARQEKQRAADTIEQHFNPTEGKNDE